MRRDKIVARVFLLFFVAEVALAAPAVRRERHQDLADAASEKRAGSDDEASHGSGFESMPELASDSDEPDSDSSRYLSASDSSLSSGSSRYSSVPTDFGSDHSFLDLDDSPPGSPSGTLRHDSELDEHVGNEDWEDNMDEEDWDWEDDEEHQDGEHEDWEDEDWDDDDSSWDDLNEEGGNEEASEYGEDEDWGYEGEEDEVPALGQNAPSEASYHDSAPQSPSGSSHQNSAPESPSSSHYYSAPSSLAGSVHQDSVLPHDPAPELPPGPHQGSEIASSAGSSHQGSSSDGDLNMEGVEWDSDTDEEVHENEQHDDEHWQHDWEQDDLLDEEHEGEEHEDPENEEHEDPENEEPLSEALSHDSTPLLPSGSSHQNSAPSQLNLAPAAPAGSLPQGSEHALPLHQDSVDSSLSQGLEPASPLHQDPAPNLPSGSPHLDSVASSLPQGPEPASPLHQDSVLNDPPSGSSHQNSVLPESTLPDNFLNDAVKHKIKVSAGLGAVAGISVGLTLGVQKLINSTRSSRAYVSFLFTPVLQTSNRVTNILTYDIPQ